MPHVPSFAIGCFFSGAAFLLVHQELSHRRRLTRKWEIREYAEEQFGSFMSRISDPGTDRGTKKVSKNLFTPILIKLTSFNKGYVEYVLRNS